MCKAVLKRRKKLNVTFSCFIYANVKADSTEHQN